MTFLSYGTKDRKSTRGGSRVPMNTSGLERRIEAIRLREAGLSYAKIGRRWGISKQRVSQIVKGKPKPKRYGLESKEILMPREVAWLVGIHVNTVRRWGERGILKSYRINSRGDRRFRREEVVNFLATKVIG